VVGSGKGNVHVPFFPLSQLELALLSARSHAPSTRCTHSQVHALALTLSHTHIHNARWHTSEKDAVDALRQFDGAQDKAVHWILDKKEAEKKARDKKDAREAQELQNQMLEDQRGRSDLQSSRLQRETEKETGMIGDLFELQTRQKHAKRDSQGPTHSSQPLAKKQRSHDAGGTGGRRLATSNLGDHAFLLRNVIYKYQCGQVQQAVNSDGLCWLLVRFEHDSSSKYFHENQFVERWDVGDPAEFQNSDKVLFLPPHLHSRGSVPRAISIGESNVFHYEENVVCEVPENYFGPRYEYIRFQIFDPSHTDIWQVRDVEQIMQEARLFAETDFAASDYDRSFKLRHGTPYKLKIFDTNKCRCGEIAAKCRCKKGRGWGVMAEQDIREGEVVMEYVGVVKLKPGKTLPCKDRGGKGTNASDGVRNKGHNSTKERERGMPPKIKLDGTKLCPQDIGDAEHGKGQKEKGKQCEEVNAEDEGVNGRKSAVEDGEGRGVPMTQQAVVNRLMGSKFARFFPRYGWFEGEIISFNEVESEFLVRYNDGDQEKLNFYSLGKYLQGEDRNMVKNFLKSQHKKRIGQEGNGGSMGSVEVSLQNIPQMDGGIHRDEGGQECHDTNPTRGGHVVVTSDEDSRGGKLARADDTEGKIKDSDGSEVGGEGSSSTGNGDRGDLVDEEQIGLEEEEVSKECEMQNLIFDPNTRGKWLIDATEKGNVSYFFARTHAEAYVILTTQYAKEIKLC